MSLNVVSYNIKFSSLIFEEEISELATRLDAQILCLQEFPLRKLSQWRRQMEKLGFRNFLAQKTCETLLGTHQSNVIFSRFPLEDRHSVDLTFKDHEPRKAQYCLVDAGPGKKVFVLHTHLGLRREERLFQMKKVGKILRNHEEIDRMILLGDFNDWNNAGEKELGPLFKEAHCFVHGRCAQTFPSKFPLLRLDRIYFRNLRPLSCSVLKSKYFQKKSDHLPLRASFDLPQN